MNESTRIFGISFDDSTQPTTAEIYFDDAEQGGNEVSTESGKFDDSTQPTTAEIYFDDAEQGDNEVSTESAKFDENSTLGEIHFLLFNFNDFN